MTAVAAAHDRAMLLVDPVTQLEVLDHATCMSLLADEEIGRIGIVDGNQPLVLPVNYALDGEVVVFRTDPGTKLRVAGRGPVAFEVDGFDRERRTGWSVLVKGRLVEVDRYDEPALVARIRALPVTPWAGGAKGHWLRVVPTTVTGRRILPE